MNHEHAAVVRIDDVSKRFVLHVDKSLKERALSVFSGRSSKTAFLALDGIHLDIGLGETVGLIGHNGSGKSTLLKVIGGIIEPTTGTVLRRGRVAALLELGAGFHPDLSGRDNVYLNAAILGMSTEETDAAFDDIVEFSGIGEFIDTQVKFYSSGMYVRLAFAVAVHSDPDILLVDEVLAVGDEPFQLKCMTKIRQFQHERRTIILVSHSAEQVADICTRAIVLDGGRLVHDGDVAEGIRTLRDGYERDRVQAEVDHSAGKPPSVDVKAVTVRVNGEPSVGPIPPHADLEITIAVEVRDPVDWVTGFTLSTSLGQAVYRLNSEGLGITLPTAPGDYEVSFIIRNANFATSRLVVSAGATTPDGTILSVLDPAGHLDFTNDPAGAGFVQFAVAGAVVPATARS